MYAQEKKKGTSKKLPHLANKKKFAEKIALTPFFFIHGIQTPKKFPPGTNLSSSIQQRDSFF